MEKQCKQYQTLFFWAPKSLQMVTAALKVKDARGVARLGITAEKAEERVVKTDLFFPAVPEVVCESLRIIPWASCKVPRCSDLGTMGLPH